MKKNYYSIIKKVNSSDYVLLKTNKSCTRFYETIGIFSSYEDAEIAKKNLVKSEVLA